MPRSREHCEICVQHDAGAAKHHDASGDVAAATPVLDAVAVLSPRCLEAWIYKATIARKLLDVAIGRSGSDTWAASIPSMFGSGSKAWEGRTPCLLHYPKVPTLIFGFQHWTRMP